MAIIDVKRQSANTAGMKPTAKKALPAKRALDVKFMVRLTRPRHDQLKAVSARTGVSLNALINQAIEAAGDQIAPDAAVAKYRLGLLRAKPSLTPDEQIEVTYIQSRWPELQP